MRTRTKAERVASRLMGYGLPVDAVKDPRSSELAEVWTFEKAGALYAIGFWGSSAKASFYYRYRTDAERQEKARSFFKATTEHAGRQAAAKAERKAAPRGLEVGDLLRSSWGYDQTNIDYYQVTALIGSKKVEIRKIGGDSEDTGWLCGRCVPVKDKFIENAEPMVCLARNGTVKVREWGCWAHKMEGKDLGGGKKVYSSSYWSAYA